jgi:hypothetical protein
VQLQGGSRLVAQGEVKLGGGLLSLLESSDMAGDGNVILGSGSTLRLDHGIGFSGSLAVDGTLTLTSGSVVFDLAGTLALGASGTINNPGRIEVGGFVDLGGTLVGNAPVIRPGGGVQISGIQLNGVGAVPQNWSSTEGLFPRVTVVVDCRGPAGSVLSLETSFDLRVWHTTAAAAEALAPGEFRLTVTVPAQGHQFFRLNVLKGMP